MLTGCRLLTALLVGWVLCGLVALYLMARALRRRPGEDPYDAEP